LPGFLFLEPWLNYGNENELLMTPFFKITVKILIGLLVLWIGGFALFVQNVYKHTGITQSNVEAIVVLTGGRERLKTGFQLLCKKQADVIFISGVHPEETLKTVLKTLKASKDLCEQDQNWLRERTHLGYTATNTRENAREVAQWLKMRKITSILLVTAAYHMPRSLLEFRHQLPEKVTIVPYSVFPGKLQEGQWWLEERIFPLMISEYHKFLWAFMRIYLTG
jgi:uncharacterized SAM-binding protein YcdF (DUF218 family)